MGLFKKLFSIFQGESDEEELEDFSNTLKQEGEAAAIKKKAEEEAAAIKKKAEEEAAAIKRKAEEEAAAKKKAEEEAAAKKKAEEEAAAKKKAEEEAAAKKKAEEEAVAKKKAEEEACKATIGRIITILKKRAEEKAVAKEKAEEKTTSPVSVTNWRPVNKKATHITIPANVRRVTRGDRFDIFKKLEEVTFSENIEEIGESTFEGCNALEKVDLSNCKKLKTIGRNAFSGCTALEEIDLSNCKELKEIGDAAFYSCYSLRRVDLPDSITKLGQSVFLQCKLKSLSLPKELKKLPALYCEIKSIDMSRCRNLKVLTESLRCSNTTIVIPYGVEEIDEKVFSACLNLQSIYLPPTIKEVELAYTISDVYCYAPELDNVKDIIEKCGCLFVLPQYFDSYYDQAVAEDAAGCLDKIPDDKLYFYDE